MLGSGEITRLAAAIPNFRAGLVGSREMFKIMFYVAPVDSLTSSRKRRRTKNDMGKRVLLPRGGMESTISRMEGHQGETASYVRLVVLHDIKYVMLLS